MKKIILNITLFLIILDVGGQVDSVRLNSQYLKHYGTDTRDIVIAPVKWGKKDFMRFGLFAATTTALVFADQPVGDFFQRQRSGRMDKIVDGFFDPLGSKYSVALGGVFYLVGGIGKNSRMRSTGLLVIESYLASGFLVNIAKRAIGRQRPDKWGINTPYGWNGPFQGTSFPSGHTTSAFSVATIFALQYKDTKWVPLVAYGLAGLAGISRVYENRHWASDVFAGAILGTVIGRYIYKAHSKNQLMVVPVTQNGLTGLKVFVKI
ncbi:hypothetical protein MNBD_BACTEROID01-819 [hydrothermal vent metagenome]|uniref:Phosphatidic acid phosphatase type 2/haloperoxidase domain-containing protein n=1 Tax=hydrothermal vent metagenome TaxID=652676 RepID=A0A3B0UZ52_9ZZZZ